MSNVLIGILGIILFIGLALAGAVILGDDFRTSRSATKAAAISSQLQQIAAAVNMYQMKTGQQMLASTFATNMATLQPRFLRSVPPNPSNGMAYYTVDAASGVAAVPVQFIYTNIGSDEAARQVCRAIEENAGATDPDASSAGSATWATMTAANRRIGCTRYDATELDAYIPV